MNKNIAEIILIAPQNRMLLQLREMNRNILGSGCWGLLGGSIRNESPISAIIRELREEIAYTITNTKSQPITVVIDSDGKNIYKHHLFYMRVQDDIESQPVFEGKKIKLFTFDELQTLNLVPWFNRVYLPSIRSLLHT